MPLVSTFMPIEAHASMSNAPKSKKTRITLQRAIISVDSASGEVSVDWQSLLDHPEMRFSGDIEDEHFKTGKMKQIYKVRIAHLIFSIRLDSFSSLL